MSVTLRKRLNANGTKTLMLDIYHDGVRRYERLAHLQLAKPSNIQDKENNKELLRQAELIRLNRSVELERSNYNVESESGKKTVVAVWMQSYIDSYTKKDIRTVQGVLNRFIVFLGMQKKTGLTFGNINALIIEDFIDYLQANSKGEGARSYYNRFKKMLRQAYRKRLMKENVLDFVEKKMKGNAKRRDTLTLDELKTLKATPTESSEVKRAFLFSCVTGLRWCDIKAVKWGNINLKSRQMNVKQSKTGEALTTPLNDTAINLLGEAGKTGDYVFTLPTANGANKTVKAWVKRAKINKAISWHNSRHTFGTNLIYNDVDILTASKLLGHTSMKHTQRYVKASEEMKQVATDKINIPL